MPRPVCWSKARGTRRELRPIPMGEAEIDSLLFRQKRYLTCLLSSFYAKNAKKKEVEIPQWTVGSEQWSVRPAPPVIFIVRREGLIICKAGLRSPAVWGLVSKASSTTSRKLLRIIHLPKPVCCSEARSRACLSLERLLLNRGNATSLQQSISWQCPQLLQFPVAVSADASLAGPVSHFFSRWLLCWVCV